MSAGAHMIVYAAPAHDPVCTVECSCGWSVTGDPSDGRSHSEVLEELLAQWVSHVEEATAGGG